MAQTYSDPVPRLRMKQGLCPECGNVPSRHDGWGGPDRCSLTDMGVAQRLHAYRAEEATKG